METAERGLKTEQRYPAVPIAVAFGIGILADRYVSPSFMHWCAAGVACVLLWAACRLLHRSALSVLLLLALVCCAGAARHHAFWSLRAANDVSRFVQADIHFARLRGVIAEAPMIRSAQRAERHSAWPQLDTTLTVLSCNELIGRSESHAVSGKVQLRVAGHLVDVRVGDEIEVTGWIGRPQPPANPGDFDYADFLRRHRIDTVLHVSEPTAVTVTRAGSSHHIGRFFARMRRAAESVLVRRLNVDLEPVAAALLIGERGRLPEDDRDAFAQSGMMHVLAISGLHVGIFAAFVWFICRLLNLAEWSTTFAVLLAVVALAVLSGGRPPIVRAAVLIFITMLGGPWHRQATILNSLAVSALLLLSVNPTNVFDTGAQLSFLAVLGIVWAEPGRRSSSTTQFTLGDDEKAQTTLFDALRPALEYARQTCRLLCGIWLFTAPLAAATFHLFSPIGWLLNLLLMPLVVVMLWCGYAMLISAALIPFAASAFAVLFGGLLAGFLAVVRWSAELPWGHFDLPDIPTWWVVGYYAGLAAWMLIRRRRKWSALRGVFLIAAWCAVGVFVPVLSPAERELRCTFLSVGHGVSVLIEAPNGKTLLYDAGCIDDARRPFRAVRHALWSRGKSSLDGIVVSHADLDHMNAAPKILDEIPTAGVFVSPSMLDETQAGVLRLLTAANRNHVPIQSIGRGDAVPLDANVSIQVLHPPAGKVYETDNENSIVLRIRFAGRSILLTGDLEGAGLAQLMESEGGDDVVMAPHHGGRKSNIPEFAAWAQPKTVIVCTGDYDRWRDLADTYAAGTEILATSVHGAVTVTVRADGAWNVEPFRRAHVRVPDRNPADP